MAARLDWGRLNGDTARVLVARWGPIGLAILVIGTAPPILISALWQWAATGGLLKNPQVLTVASLSAVLAHVVTSSATGAVVGAITLGTLDGDDPSGRRPQLHLVSGFAAAFAANLLVNWPGFAMLFLSHGRAPQPLTWGIAIAAALGYIPVAAFFLLASSAALQDGGSVFTAFRRSARLQRGLRWQSLGLFLADLLLVAIIQFSLLRLVLAIFPAHAILVRDAATGTGLIVASVFRVLSTALYVQARDIADGPSARELATIFA